MAKRCLHPRLKTFTFKSGEVITLCPDCKHGEGHEDQKTPILGRLYTRYRNAESVEPGLDVLDTDEESGEVSDEIAELMLPTFAALEDEPEVPTVEPGEEESDGEEVEEEEIEA